jgi:hypothetical protein
LDPPRKRRRAVKNAKYVESDLSDDESEDDTGPTPAKQRKNTPPKTNGKKKAYEEGEPKYGDDDDDFVIRNKKGAKPKPKPSPEFFDSSPECKSDDSKCYRADEMLARRVDLNKTVYDVEDDEERPLVIDEERMEGGDGKGEELEEGEYVEEEGEYGEEGEGEDGQGGDYGGENEEEEGEGGGQE